VHRSSRLGRRGKEWKKEKWDGVQNYSGGETHKKLGSLTQEGQWRRRDLNNRLRNIKKNRYLKGRVANNSESVKERYRTQGSGEMEGQSETSRKQADPAVVRIYRERESDLRLAWTKMGGGGNELRGCSRWLRLKNASNFASTWKMNGVGRHKTNATSLKVTEERALLFTGEEEPQRKAAKRGGRFTCPRTAGESGRVEGSISLTEKTGDNHV